MKVFISWSGDRSLQVATLLNEWLGDVMQHVTPWFSPNMDRGAVWFTDIFNALGEASAGVICLTRENMNNPWILFEAGAIAKGATANRVCTLAIDLDPKDIQAPLGQFNATRPIRESMYELVKTINAASGKEALDTEKLCRSFDKHWPQFEARFQVALDKTNASVSPHLKRTTDEILADILDTVHRLERSTLIPRVNNFPHSSR